ncbi:hypothetical protein HBB16_07390 [Pseudonocardia sp. MCCB 268]|nr:hypothetical protein [Pseudonocardia cytotoxica]
MFSSVGPDLPQPGPRTTVVLGAALLVLGNAGFATLPGSVAGDGHGDHERLRRGAGLLTAAADHAGGAETEPPPRTSMNT